MDALHVLRGISSSDHAWFAVHPHAAIRERGPERAEIEIIRQAGSEPSRLDIRVIVVCADGAVWREFWAKPVLP